jgi:5-methylcytosine-specific restriction endonuclease McrA
MEDLKFKLERAKNTPVSDEEILSDLKRVSCVMNSSKVTQKLYGEHGQYDYSNVGRRFGTWNKALEAAGLSISNQCNISDEALFENMLLLWQHYGRQPRRAELAHSPSTISQSAYNRRFKSWVVALEHFVEYANSTDVLIPARAEEKVGSRTTGRDPSLRLRFKVLSRDRFTCQHCGSSPAKMVGVELHVDHIIAWSKGGETILENLQTLCSKCNLGKSNL